jgi:Flp pilus assembly pilin Flp
MTFRNPLLRLKRQKGQGMTEYTLIIVLVAVAALLAFKLFGAQIRGLLTRSSKEISATTGTATP